jgi:hypothetical protein
VLGPLWRLRFSPVARGCATLLLVYARPPGADTPPRGELRVRPGAHGGTRLFSGVAFASGNQAVHQLLLPLDSALFGFPLSFQAISADAAGNERFCNALDVVLTPYE